MARQNTVVTLEGQSFVLSQCRTCGVLYTTPEVVWDQQYAEGGYHYCSNGHTWGWSKTTCEREQLRRERDRLKQDAARLNDEIVAERSKRVAAEATTRRLKKRTAAGTCPCCKRSFSNMAEHMKHQHPDFVSETGAKVVPIKRAG